MTFNRVSSSTAQGTPLAAEAPRPSEATPAAPAIARDDANWSSTARQPAGPTGHDGKFTLDQALKFFARGLAYPVFSLIDGFKHRPAQTALVLGGGLAAVAALTWGLPLALTAVGAAAIAPFAVPVLFGAMAAFFGIKGGVNLVKGIMAARDHHAKGALDLAERDFEQIGQGVFDLASAGFAGKQALDAFRAAQAARAASLAAAEAEAMRAYAANMPKRLADLEATVAKVVPGQALSPQARTAMMEHLDWSFQGWKITPAQKEAIIDAVASGKSFHETNGAIAKIAGQRFAYSDDANHFYYLTKHLTRTHAEDMLGVVGKSVQPLAPVGAGIFKLPESELWRAAKVGPQMGFGEAHPGNTLTNNFLQTIHQGDLAGANRIIALARRGLEAATKP